MHHLSEFQQGLISVNEYRKAVGRKRVDGDIADSLLANPNQTPIANTEKTQEEIAAEQEEAAAAEGGAVPTSIAPGGGAPSAGVGESLDAQRSAAFSQDVAEFSPEVGGFVPAGTVQGTDNIEAPASRVPSESAL